MGLFVNITMTTYQNRNCTGPPVFVKQIFEECFKVAEVCCRDYFQDDIPMNTCYDGEVVSCSSSTTPIDIMNYMIQIFGITFMVVVLTGCMYISIRCVVFPPKKEESQYEEIV
jgi:transcriptional regulator GlxA family with amidase domain